MWFVTRTNLVRFRTKFSTRLFKIPNDSKVANRNDFKKTRTKQSPFTNQIAHAWRMSSTKRCGFDGRSRPDKQATSSNCSNACTRVRTSYRALSRTPTAEMREYHPARRHALVRRIAHGSASIGTWSQWHRRFACISSRCTAQGARSRDTLHRTSRMDGSLWTAPSQDDPSRTFHPASNPV